MLGHQKFSVADLTLCVPFLIAVILSWCLLPPGALSTIAYIALTEFLLLVVGVKLLSRELPPALQSAAEDNCFRLNGTRSSHRTRLESTARRRLQIDVLAILLIVLLTGNGLALAVHYFIIPLPLGVGAIMSFRVDGKAWKEELTRRNIDSRFEQTYRESNRASPKQAAAAATGLWRLWPLVVFGAVAWALAAQRFLKHMYRRALSEYANGIARRRTKYADRDIDRLQQEFE